MTEKEGGAGMPAGNETSAGEFADELKRLGKQLGDAAEAAGKANQAARRRCNYVKG